MINTKDLLAALKRASLAISNRAHMPIMACVRIHAEGGRVHLAGFNFETVVVTSVPDGSSSFPPLLVNAQKLTKVLSKVKAPHVELSATTDGSPGLHVQAGKIGFDLGPDGYLENYPNLPDLAVPEPELVGFTADQVADWPRVIAAAGTDETLPTLTGVKFTPTPGGVEVAATDRYRLHVLEQTLARAFPGEALVPAKTLTQVVRLFKGEEVVTYGRRGEYAIFTAGDTTYATRLLDGQFPKYQALVPTEWRTEAEVPVKALVDTVEQLTVLLDRGTRAGTLPLQLRAGPGGVELIAKGDDADAGKAVIDGLLCTVDPTADKWAMNPKYLLDALKCATTDTVTFRVVNGIRPILIQSRPDLTLLVMPVRCEGWSSGYKAVA